MRVVPALEALVHEMGDAFPELVRAQPLIEATLAQEEAQFRRTLALQVPQRPKHARASEVKAFETASRLVAFIIERMQGPMTLGKAIPLNVVHDGLDGVERTRRIPGSVAKRFMAIRLEEHGMAARVRPWLLGRRAYCSEQMVNSYRYDCFVA